MGHREGEATASDRLDTGARFETFIESDGTRLACSAARAVAEAPGRRYNPLYLHGPSGVGKSHLLQAIAQRVLETRPSTSVCYRSSDRFTAEFVQSIRSDRTAAFRCTVREAHMLLIEDVQLLAGRRRTQEELLHAYDDLHQQGRQIVFSGDRPPQDLEGLEVPLISRFRCGLVAPLEPPDLPARVSILRAKASVHGIALDEAALKLIASRVPPNVRELEGMMIRAAAYASLVGEPISAAMLDQWLPEGHSTESPVDLESILRAVARRYQLEISALTGRSRRKEIVHARHIAMYLGRELTRRSYPSLAQEFGGRDHATIMHACRKISHMLVEPAVREEIESLEAQLGKRAVAGRRLSRE